MRCLMLLLIVYSQEPIKLHFICLFSSRYTNDFNPVQKITLNNYMYVLLMIVTNSVSNPTKLFQYTSPPGL